MEKSRKYISEKKSQNPSIKKYANAEGIVDFMYVSISQECTLVEDIANNSPNEKEIINKFFNKYSEDNNYLYLKNKYLYYTTDGAINYLEAHKSMSKNTTDNLGLIEKELLEKLIQDNYANTALISLGSATSRKEIDALKSVFTANNSANVSFFPIDVSPTLMQLGVLRFKNEIGNKRKICPIISDFWNLPEVLSDLPFKTGFNKRIFTLFGATIGNYYEYDLINCISELMQPQDILIIGFETHNIKKDLETEKNRIYNEYNTFKNMLFLTQPFNYIPKLKGYSAKIFDYFSQKIDDSILTNIDSKYEKKLEFITNVPNIITYSPFINIPISIYASDSTSNFFRLAQSTKYEITSFFNWFKEKFNNLKLIDYTELSDKNCCVVYFKKVNVIPETYRDTDDE